MLYNDIERRRQCPPRRDYHRAYYAAHRDALRAHRATPSVREAKSEYDRAYSAAHRSEQVAYDRAYRAAHLSERAAHKRASRAAHLDAVREYDRAYFAAHPRDRAAYMRAYRAAHPDQRAAQANRRRARKVGAASTLTAAQWVAIKAAYGSRCAYCRTKVARPPAGARHPARPRRHAHR